jgi:hypothetical protein
MNMKNNDIVNYCKNVNEQTVGEVDEDRQYTMTFSCW